MNSAASMVSVKFEDSEIGIDKIVERIGKGKFRVKEAVEVPTPEEAVPVQ